VPSLKSGRIGADLSAVARRAKAEGVIRRCGGYDGGSMIRLHDRYRAGRNPPQTQHSEHPFAKGNRI
jgi:hypothetical protein